MYWNTFFAYCNSSFFRTDSEGGWGESGWKVSDHLTCRTGTLFSPPHPVISVGSVAETQACRIQQLIRLCN